MNRNSHEKDLAVQYDPKVRAKSAQVLLSCFKRSTASRKKNAEHFCSLLLSDSAEFGCAGCHL